MPRPDFPKTLPEFVRRFPDDDACWEYLVASRWPDGVTCEDGETVWFNEKRKLFECPSGHQFSVTSGTVMHRTKLPLHVWFWAAYLVTTNKVGMSAKQFARQLDLHYETAYMLLQKLRAGMVNPERGKIGGPGKTVEVDEAFFGGGRKAEGRKDVLTPLLAAVEVKGETAGRLRMQVAPTKGTADVIPFIRSSVADETLVMTDGSPSYRLLEKLGYHHAVSEMDVEYRLPVVHRVFSNLRAWWLGTHHGAVSHKHLQAYVNEFVFRFNRRNTPMAAFQTVLGIGTQVAGPTYEGIYEGTWTHKNPKRSA